MRQNKYTYKEFYIQKREYVVEKYYYIAPNGVSPIACKQAHGAVVLCKHNPTVL